MAEKAFEFVPEAWRNTGGKNVTIALFDTGLSLEHAALKHLDVPGRKFYPAGLGFDSANSKGEDDVSDATFRGQFHGTQMAGILSAIPEEEGSPRGICPDSELLIFKMRDANFNSFFEYFLNAVNVCLRKSVDVIVCAFTPIFQRPVSDAVLDGIFQDMKTKGIHLVSCGSNSGRLDRFNALQFPASRTEAINTGVLQNNLLQSWEQGDELNSGIHFVWPQSKGVFYDDPEKELLHINWRNSQATAALGGIVALLIAKWKEEEGDNYKARTKEQITEELDKIGKQFGPEDLLNAEQFELYHQ